MSIETAVFDPLAPTYDDDFTRSPIARHLRARVHARLDVLVQRGEAALELGCGTGEDALHLARRGVRLTATDASAAMLAVAQAKLRDYDNVTLAQFDLSDLNHEGTKDTKEHEGEEKRGLRTEVKGLSKTPIDEAKGENHISHSELRTRNSELNTQSSVLSPQSYTLAFANFGVINCLRDWQPLARWLAARVVAGGHAALGVMSPVCAWETAWHTAHGDFYTATRRWRKGTAFTLQSSVLSPQSMIYYPSILRLTRDFAPYFNRVHVEPLGVFLPPSDVYGAVEKRPRLLRVLTRLDDSIGRWRALALLADHYWIEFKRV